MLSEELDLDDLEARLYGQIYHTNSGDKSPSVLSNPATPTVSIELPIVEVNPSRPIPSKRKSRNLRYYQPITQVTTSPSSSKSPNDQSFFVQKLGDANLLFQKNTTERATELSQSCLNNITVNQYTYSPVLLNTPPRPFECYERLFNLNRNRRSSKSPKVKQAMKRKKNQGPKKQKQVQNQIILVSDESDCEVEIVGTESSKKSEEQVQLACDDDDPDAIVYIEPPPVPLVTIDSDEENIEKNEKNSSEEKTILEQTPTATNDSISPELLNTPESTNDFLDQSGINLQPRFNFSLHGTDFSQTNEFVKPANPDPCETESSCSTSDCTRDFNNSLKTVVFSEVEFPREDLFCEQNLESFGTFITQKRVSETRSENRKDRRIERRSGQLKKNNTQTAVENDTSISRNECDSENLEDVPLSTRKKLPTLSPMNSADSSLKNKTLTDNKGSEKDKNSEKKKKKNKKPKKTCSEVNQMNDTSTDNNDLDNSYRSDSEKQKRKLNETESKKKKKLKGKETTSVSVNRGVNCDESNKEDLSLSKKIPPIDLDSQNDNKKQTSKSRKRKQSEEARQTENLITETEARCAPQNGQTESNSVQDNAAIASDFTDPNKTELEENADKKKKNKRKISKTFEANSENINENNTVESKENSTSLTNNVTEPLIEVGDISIAKENEEYQEANNTQCSTIEEFRSEYELQMLQPDVVLKSQNNSAITEAIIQDAGDTIDLNEFIVVDEDDPIIVDDSLPHTSDSEEDFRDLTDVGLNMELANTINTTTERSFVGDQLRESDSFDLDLIWSKMSDDPEKWKISAKDRLGAEQNLRKGPKCKRCRRVGHLTNNCPNKPSKPTCSLCGNPGHYAVRCPNQVCFQCGTPGNYSTPFCQKCANYKNSICTLCKTRGHIIDTCPDVWRRYHLTTKPGPLQIRNGSQAKPRDKQWCSGCAQRGHLEHECNSYYYHREYPPVAPYIHDYEDLYSTWDHGRTTNKNAGSQRINPAHFSQNVLPNEPNVNMDVLPGAIEINQNIGVEFQQNNFFGPHIYYGINNFCNIADVPQMIPQLVDQGNNYLAGSTVINPFSILQNPTGNTAGKSINPNKIEIYNHLKGETHVVFRSSTIQNLKKFIDKDIQQLNRLSLKAKDLHRKNFLIDKKISNLALKQAKKYKRKISKEITGFYRKMNMFLFGIHQLREGQKHLNTLKRFVENSTETSLSPRRRMSLERAYNYIFGGDRNTSVEYRKVLGILIHKEKTNSGM